LRRIVTTSDPNTWTQLTAEWWLAAYLYRQQMIIEAKPSTSAMGCGCSWVLTTSERTNEIEDLLSRIDAWSGGE
jgi:hypothetical protein